MVGQAALNRSIGVRLPVSQPAFTQPSRCRRPGLSGRFASPTAVAAAHAVDLPTVKAFNSPQGRLNGVPFAMNFFLATVVIVAATGHVRIMRTRAVIRRDAFLVLEGPRRRTFRVLVRDAE